MGGTLQFDWEAQLQRWEEEEAALGGETAFDPVGLLDRPPDTHYSANYL